MENNKSEFLKNPIEKKQIILKDIWSEILNKPDIGIHDDFFMAGGTSKDLVKMVTKMSEIFEISMQEVFSKSTIAEIAPVIDYRKDGLKDDVDKIYYLTEKLKNYVPSEEYNRYMDNYIKYNSEIKLGKREEYKKVLVTGGNGFLSCHLIEKILKNRKTSIVVLVREKSNEKAAAKFKRAMDWYFEKEDILKNYSGRLKILSGDVSVDKLGLDDDVYSELSKTVDAVFHVAGILRHYGHWEEFYNTNVDGTKRIIEFAKLNTRKDIHFISTMGTGYNEERAKNVLPFTELEVQKDSYAANYYLKSKMLAEKELEKEINQNNLNVKIYRPGYLVQNYETGIFQVNSDDNAYFQFFKAIMEIGCFPAMETEIFDFSFIDQAAEAIDILSTVEEERHIYHLFNPQRLSMKEIGELMIENGVNIKSVSVKEFCEYLKDNMEKYKDLISNITMVTYVREKDIEQLIDLCLKCDRTTQILANYGFEWNSLDKKHMADIINIIN